MCKSIRIISFVFVLLMLCNVSLADIPQIDFSEYSNQQLIELQAAIQIEKLNRGYGKSAVVHPGKYTVGIDLPAGTYRVETQKGMADHLYVYSAKGKMISSYAIGTAKDRAPIGKLELHDGETVEWGECTVMFVVSSGTIFFN